MKLAVHQQSSPVASVWMGVSVSYRNHRNLIHNSSLIWLLNHFRLPYRIYGHPMANPELFHSLSEWVSSPIFLWVNGLPRTGHATVDLSRFIFVQDYEIRCSMTAVSMISRERWKVFGLLQLLNSNMKWNSQGTTFFVETT